MAANAVSQARVLVCSLSLLLGAIGLCGEPGRASVALHDFDRDGILDCPACHLSNATHVPGRPATGRGGRVFKVYGAFAESLVCIGCHDGALATEPPRAGNPLAGFGQGSVGRGTVNHHPYAIAYDPGKEIPLARPELVDASGLRLYGGGNDPSVRYRIECPTCHDIHNQGVRPFLRVSADGLRLCVICHRRPGYRATASHKSVHTGGSDNECLLCHEK